MVAHLCEVWSKVKVEENMMAVTEKTGDAWRFSLIMLTIELCFRWLKFHMIRYTIKSVILVVILRRIIIKQCMSEDEGDVKMDCRDIGMY